MAITTVDGIIAGGLTPHFFAKSVSNTNVAGRPVSFWGFGGIPGAGSYDTTLNGVVLSSASSLVDGQIPFYNAASGKQKYLGRLVAMATQAGPILLCDRLWHNGGITITSNTAQSITSPTWPARDNGGTTNGEGVLIGCEVSAATGSGTPTITVSYTNSAGTSGRSGTNQHATAASTVAGTFFPIGLQGNDKGVKSVESVTLSATWTSGTINLVAYRVLGVIDGAAANVGGSIDPVSGGMPKLYDGTVPFIVVIPNSTTAFRVYGQVTYVEG